jgi:hypothetical protein
MYAAVADSLPLPGAAVFNARKVSELTYKSQLEQQSASAVAQIHAGDRWVMDCTAGVQIRPVMHISGANRINKRKTGFGTLKVSMTIEPDSQLSPTPFVPMY